MPLWWIDGEAQDERTTREFYEVIQNEANRLSRLIDNILNISRIESGLVKINKQPQSLGVIIKEAVEVITPQAKQKNIVVNPTSAPSTRTTSNAATAAAKNIRIRNSVSPITPACLLIRGQCAAVPVQCYRDKPLQVGVSANRSARADRR